MGNYSVNHKTDYIEVIYINTPTNLCGVYGIMIGNYTLSSVGRCKIARLISKGLLGVSLAANKLDPVLKDSTVIAEGGMFAGVDPNYGTTLMDIMLLSNTTFKWTGKKKNKIFSVIGSELGIGMSITSGSSLNYEATMFWEE